MTGLLLVLLLLVGLLLGAVLNPVVDRYITEAPSVATDAPNLLRALWPVGPLRRRTRIRYAAVQLLTAALFVAIPLRLHHLHRLPALPAYLYLAAAGTALAFIDFAAHRLPNRIVLPSYPVLLTLLSVGAGLEHSWQPLLRAVEGGFTLYLLYLVLALIHPAGMGFGDVKLAGVLGGCLAYLSWSALVIGGVAGFVLAAVVGIGIVVTRRGSMKTALPFGPFMLVGAALALFTARELASAYLQLATPG